MSRPQSVVVPRWTSWTCPPAVKALGFLARPRADVDTALADGSARQMSNVFEVESVCRPGKFYLSGISTEVVCQVCQVGWFAGNVIMIMARFNSGIFWLCIRKKKHLEVFKFDFEKNEMPNVPSVESSADARSTLWESTRWCLLKVIPAFWCLKI